MQLHDTLSGGLRALPRPGEGPLRMYTCGPTVYRYAHLGNFRTFLLPDLIRPALEWEGLPVRQVVNITDVGHLTDERLETGDDRMLAAAEAEGKSPEEIANHYTTAFLEDSERLGLLPAAEYPRASQNVGLLIDLVERLRSAGHAYVREGSVYYDVTSFPGYGKLSGNRLDCLRAGHRVAPASDKRNPFDFLLWRAAGPHRLVSFDSPWGAGFPGWHLECSAMSLHYLGDSFELHTGGMDLIFPHHEDEIAQSEAAVGHRVVGHWSHGDHLLFEGRKMAKSSENYWRVNDLLERGYDARSFRLLCYTGRYRRQLHFSWEALEAAQRSLVRLRRLVADAGEPADELSRRASGFDRRFRATALDDLDLPRALPVLWEMVGSDVLHQREKAALLLEWDRLLGLDLGAMVGRVPSVEIRRLLARRESARLRRDWPTADRLRDQLHELGVALVDGPQGTDWHWRS